jgi:hypothetical protein
VTASGSLRTRMSRSRCWKPSVPKADEADGGFSSSTTIMGIYTQRSSGLTRFSVLECSVLPPGPSRPTASELNAYEHRTQRVAGIRSPTYCASSAQRAIIGPFRAPKPGGTRQSRAGNRPGPGPGVPGSSMTYPMPARV